MPSDTTNDTAHDELSGKRMAETRGVLEALAQDRFNFLLAEQGFAKGPTEHSASVSAYAYKDRHQAPQLAVQTLLDFGEGLVDVSLVRPEGGRLPKLGQTERQGRRVRVSLVPLLREVLLVKDARLQQAAVLAATKPPCGAQLAAQMLDLGGELLRRHLELVLQQPVDVLFPLRGKVRSGNPR